ncbi:MAG TPA: hypothetical protein VF403_13675 [Kofleriaceae bacterium]|jgi:hypothetical protein
MSDFQTEMNRVVGEFVAAITELAKRAAIDTLESALGGGGKRGGGLSLGRGGGGGSRRRGAKRTSSDLDQLGEDFHSFVSKHPGMRIEQINKQLNTTTKDLALPIRKMISDGSLKTKGEKRSTMYFAGEKKKKKD